MGDIKLIKVGINGFGRIGRNVLRIAQERLGSDIQIVAINARADANTLAHLFKYDSCYGIFNGDVEVKDNETILINSNEVKILRNSDPADIPWGELGVDIVVESTGKFRDRESASKHLVAGAKKVIITAPAKGEDITVVLGVNEKDYDNEKHNIISNASCTTNCLAPICKVLEDNYGIEYGLMSTIHAATAKQKVVDCRSLKDWRTGRAVFGNLIPSTTGAAKAISLVIPSLKDKMNGISYRVPTSDVSIVDLNVALSKATSYEDICQKVREASMTYLSGILDCVDDEVVSSDFIGDPHASIFDIREGIQVNSHFFKLICFYDNEWGYTCQIFRLIKYMNQIDQTN